MFEESTMFRAGTSGYHTYRIPALAVTTQGTILAFCEGRTHGASDTGDIDLLLKRSFDNGMTWEDAQLIVDEGPHTAGNPAPVVDAQTGTIWLLFCMNLGDGDESKICMGEAPRTVWVTKSADDGATWSEPTNITNSVKKPSWTWYATGPGHGIQLTGGRLVVPCDHVVGTNFDRSTDPHHAHVIYSDDHGQSWQIGGVAQEGTNESTVVQTLEGALYLNCRNHDSRRHRAYAWSYDGGGTFPDFGCDENLVEPVCQASMIRLTEQDHHDKNRILFANPASTSRERLTVRLSYDECGSWSRGKVVHEGPSAYSDLCIAKDMSICCLYERGAHHPYETLALARFNLNWLTDGLDATGP